MDELSEARAAPGWFPIAAIGALLWEILGCGIYVMAMTTDPSSLPVDQRAMADATPLWMNAAWAVAVWIGLAGAVLLLMRRRLAEPLLLLSLIAVLVQFSGLLIVPELRNLVASDDLFLPFVIVVVCYGIWMLARRARKSGWLR